MRVKIHHAWTKNSHTYLGQVACGVNSVWRFFAGCCLILLVAGVLVTLSAAPLQTLESYGAMGKFIALNFHIIVLLAGLVLAVKWLQRRPLRSLIAPDTVDWRRAWQGFIVFFVISILLAMAEFLLYPGRFRLNANAAQLWVLMPFILLLVPLQAATEELVLRGYVMQSLYTFTSRPWLIVTISSCLFMALHMANPEAQSGKLALLQYLLLGIFFAVMTLRDGRLELAIGAHAANNVFGAAVLGTDGSVFDTPALFMSDTLDPIFGAASVVAAGAVFYAWIFYPRSQSPTE